MPRLAAVVTACVTASLLLAGTAQALTRSYWSPRYAETYLERWLEGQDWHLGSDDDVSYTGRASCKGLGRDRIRAPRSASFRYFFRAFNCRVGSEKYSIEVGDCYRARVHERWLLPFEVNVPGGKAGSPWAVRCG